MSWYGVILCVWIVILIMQKVYLWPDKPYSEYKQWAIAMIRYHGTHLKLVLFDYSILS